MGTWRPINDEPDIGRRVEVEGYGVGAVTAIRGRRVFREADSRADWPHGQWWDGLASTQGWRYTCDDHLGNQMPPEGMDWDVD